MGKYSINTFYAYALIILLNIPAQIRGSWSSKDIATYGTLAAFGLGAARLAYSYNKRSAQKIAQEELKEIAQKYKESLKQEEVNRILDQHRPELLKLLTEWHEYRDSGIGVKREEWLHGYFIKYGIERVSNAEKFMTVIRRRKLDLLGVPAKYVYRVIDGAETNKNSNSLVIAKEIKGRTGDKAFLNLEQVRQLWSATIGASHHDMHVCNYIVADDGRVYIIDTDAIAMPSPLKSFKLTLKWLWHGGFSRYPGSFLTQHRCNSKAGVWLETTQRRRDRCRKVILGTGISLTLASALYGISRLCPNNYGAPAWVF